MANCWVLARCGWSGSGYVAVNMKIIGMWLELLYRKNKKERNIILLPLPDLHLRHSGPPGVWSAVVAARKDWPVRHATAGHCTVGSGGVRQRYAIDGAVSPSGLSGSSCGVLGDSSTIGSQSRAGA